MITASEARAMRADRVESSLLRIEEAIRKVAQHKSYVEYRAYLSLVEVRELASLIKKAEFTVRFEDFDEDEEQNAAGRINWLVHISW